MKEARCPAALVLGYGAFFTLLLIISYVPVYLLLQRGGKRLVYRLAGGASLLSWNDEREKLSAILIPSVGLGDTLRNSIAILAPVVAGFLSLSLPK